MWDNEVSDGHAWLLLGFVRVNRLARNSRKASGGRVPDPLAFRGSLAAGAMQGDVATLYLSRAWNCAESLGGRDPENSQKSLSQSGPRLPYRYIDSVRDVDLRASSGTVRARVVCRRGLQPSRETS